MKFRKPEDKLQWPFVIVMMGIIFHVIVLAMDDWGNYSDGPLNGKVVVGLWKFRFTSRSDEGSIYYPRDLLVGKSVYMLEQS